MRGRGDGFRRHARESVKRVILERELFYAEIHRLTFNVYALFTPEGSEPILDVDQRNNILNKSFDRPR